MEILKEMKRNKKFRLQIFAGIILGTITFWVEKIFFQK